MTWEREIEVCRDVSRRAGELALRHAARGVEREDKSDDSPVTVADRECERLIVSELRAAFPGDGVLGEEGAQEVGTSGRRWIVDPIDGTRNYARGIPVWATLVALEEDGVVRLGVVSAPAIARRWWAERGAGAYANGERVHVSEIARVEDAVLSFALESEVPDLARRAWHARGFGDFWPHMLVAEGSVDGAVDAVGVSEWDLAAVQVVVEEAGGRFSDRDGHARIDGKSAVTSNGLLHDAVIAALTPR